MVLTLADVAATTDSDVDYNLINELRIGSPMLLDALVFDDVVVPGSGAATLSSTYLRAGATRPAHTRQVNTEYPAFEVKTKRVTTDLVPIGARYNIDRIIARVGAISQIGLQQSAAVQAVIAKFNDLVINGEAGHNFDDVSPQFEGIDSIVTGTITEWTDNGAAWDFSNIADKAGALKVTQQIRAWLRKFDGRPDVFLVNDEGAAFLDMVNDWINYNSAVSTAFGEQIPTYGGIPYVNLGSKGGIVDQDDVLTGEVDETPIIPISDGGETTIYAARLGLDSLHGLATPGQLFSQWLPNFADAGAVKAGEVELGPVALVAKKVRGVGAFRVRIFGSPHGGPVTT